MIAENTTAPRKRGRAPNPPCACNAPRSNLGWKKGGWRVECSACGRKFNTTERPNGVRIYTRRRGVPPEQQVSIGVPRPQPGTRNSPCTCEEKRPYVRRRGNGYRLVCNLCHRGWTVDNPPYLPGARNRKPGRPAESLGDGVAFDQLPQPEPPADAEKIEHTTLCLPPDVAARYLAIRLRRGFIVQPETADVE